MERGEGTLWEVSKAKGLAARIPVLREASDPAIIAEAIASVLKSGSAALVMRSDWTPEARRERWESEFYDLDRAGRRRRRFRKTDIERQWEKFYADERRRARSNGGSKTGNVECPVCGGRWSRLAPSSYVHVCPRAKGRVGPVAEGDG